MVGSPWIGGSASGKAASISALLVGFRVDMVMASWFWKLELGALYCNWVPYCNIGLRTRFFVCWILKSQRFVSSTETY